jgi:hypothetical protein
MLYSERRADQTALTARSLSLLFPDNRLPSGFQTPVLCAFANAILHCASSAEVSLTLNEAITREEEQAVRDKQVLSAFKAYTTRDDHRIDGFFDAAELPYPKDVILRAFEREIVRKPVDARVEDMKIGARILLCIQRSVDPYDGPDRDIEQHQRLLAAIKTEGDQINARLAAAVQQRKKRWN